MQEFWCKVNETPEKGGNMEADYKCICGLGEEHTADCALYNSGYKAGEVEGYKQGLGMREPYLAGIREVVKWGKEPCPHGVTEHSKSYAKRDCPECWETFKESKGIK